MTDRGLAVKSVITEERKTIALDQILPLFSVDINDSETSSFTAITTARKNKYNFKLPDGITGVVRIEKKYKPGWKAIIRFENSTQDTIKIANVVPFGKTDERIYLTASGPWSLARTKIFRPGLGPVGVILPDNAWEMGYGDVPINTEMSICAIARRIKNKSAICRRYWTLLPPGSNIEYTVYADSYHGTWQNGLRMMFQQRYLYDLKEFDDHLFQRKDLQWIRHKYIVTHQFAWDHEFYDFKKGEFQVEKFLTKGKRLFGGYDVFGIWPTWPRLGVDQRNQWDLYRDIPGGLEQLREVSNYAHQQGTKFFIAYNPWDKSTRPEDPYQGMARIIKAINADGVVLDCHGSSSKKLQAAADGVKPGVIMYSEGMAVPKDMPGIVAGRVHDAIYMPPPINLNKFIKHLKNILRL